MMGPKRASKASAKPSSTSSTRPSATKPKPSLSSPTTPATPASPTADSTLQQAGEEPEAHASSDPPNVQDVRLCSSIFHTLRLRMETAGAVTVSSSINLQALRHGRVKKIEFVRFPHAETKQQSAEFLQAVLRMHIARSEMLSAVASPWLPALQAIARRRMALSPKLEADRKRREEAAVEIQRHLRGTTTRRNMQEQQMETNAQNLVAGVLKALKWRKSMANASIQQATQHLQAQRRSCVAQRELQAMKDEKQDESLIRSIFRGLLQRQRLSEQTAAAAAQTLQQGRRSQISRRELSNRQQERKDEQMLLSVLHAVYWRVKTAHSVAVHSAVKLQTLQRGRVATIEMTRMREAAECFSVLAPALRCLVLRIRLASLEELQAARKLQIALKVAVAKRRNRNACIERLQRYLVGLEKKMEAQRLLDKLHAQRHASTLPRSLVRVALKAAQLRKRLAEHREHRAATTIQARARGGFHRNKCSEVQNKRSLQIILCVCRRFAVQQQLVVIQQQKLMTDALELWQSVLETFKERSQFAPDLLYNRASLKIASMWRGVKGRREMRRIRLERSAQKASDCLRGFLRCYRAREMLVTRGADCHRLDNRMLLCAALRTLKQRLLFSHKVEEERKQAAMEVLSRYVRGIYLRTGRVFDWEAYCRRTGRRVTDEMHEKMLADKAEVDLVQRVRMHTKRVRLEIEDERRQICHMAALQLQRSWRARQARLQQLLPRLAARLAAERRILVEMQHTEGQQCSSFSGGCLKPIHAQVMTARPQPPHGWLTCMAEVPESMTEVAAADSFALVLGQSGTPYCLPSHGGCDFIGSPEALELAGPFVLQHQRLLAQTPKVQQISCGLHHAVLLAEGGLAFAWGLNDSGQCGVGWPRPKSLEQQVVALATCLQPWAAHYSATAEEMRTAGLLEPQKGDSLSSACTSGAVLPRLTSLCAGPRMTLALDAEAQLWAWGASSGVGLPCYMPQTAPRAPPSRGTLRATSGGAKVLTACPFLLFQLIRNAKSVDSASSAKGEPSPDGASVAGKLRSRMDNQLLVDLDLQEVTGNVLAPTIVCNVTTLEGVPLSSAQTDTVLLYKGGQPQAILSPAWGAGGAGRAESAFASIACGRANFAVTSRGVVHSWAGTQDLLLARSGGGLPSPVSTFVRLAACVTNVSVGSDHAVALTAHGRVFTWGQLEACTSTERFQRRQIAQPLCVEGPLRGLKISKVLAGRISSVAAIHDAETLLGWDMVELLTVQGKGQLDPAIYEFTAAYHGETNQGVSPMSPKMSPKTSPTNRPRMAEKTCTSTRSPTSPSKSPSASPTKALPSKVPRNKQEVGRKLCICHSKTLQLVLDDLTTCRPNVPFSRPELFAWAGLQAASAHNRKEEDEEMIKHRSLEEMASERIAIKRMGNFALVKEVARPRDILELDREIGRYRRLSNPPEEVQSFRAVK